MLGYVARGIAYSSFVTVGVLSFISPTPTLASIGLETASFLPVILATAPYVWGGLLCLGALSCLVGVLTRTWVGEFIGISPVIFCVTALAVAQIFYGLPYIGILLIGLASILFYRWHTVRLEKKHAVNVNYQRRGWSSWYQTQDK